MLYSQIEDLLQHDKSDMLGEIYNQPEQMQNCLNDWGNISWQKRVDQYWNVLVCGMGGGAIIAGNFIKDFCWDKCKIPVELVNQPEAPNYIGPNTIAFFISSSGNTPEVFANFEAIKNAGGLCIPITGGGKLAQGAWDNNFPLITTKSKMPPRTQVATYILKILEALEFAGICTIDKSDIEETINLLCDLREQYRPEKTSDQNQLKLIARELTQYPAVVYGQKPNCYLPALRLKYQMNENAKMPAHVNAIPSYHHDELLAWDAQSSIRKNFALILMRDNQEDKDTITRYETTTKLLQDRCRYLHTLTACGKSPFARIWSMIFQADYLSAYTALLKGTDPTQLDLIKEYYQLSK